MWVGMGRVALGDPHSRRHGPRALEVPGATPRLTRDFHLQEVYIYNGFPLIRDFPS